MFTTDRTSSTPGDEVKHLHHRGDPDTSETAARRISDKARIKAAIVHLLEEEPRTVPQLVDAYRNVQALNGWPVLRDERAIDRRVSELHTAGVLFDTEERGQSRFGRPAVVWAVKAVA